MNYYFLWSWEHTAVLLASLFCNFFVFPSSWTGLSTCYRLVDLFLFGWIIPHTFSSTMRSIYPSLRPLIDCSENLHLHILITSIPQLISFSDDDCLLLMLSCSDHRLDLNFLKPLIYFHAVTYGSWITLFQGLLSRKSTFIFLVLRIYFIVSICSLLIDWI